MQGSVLSPLLFLCSADDVCQTETKKCLIVQKQLQPTYLETRAFADDVISFANSKNDLVINMKVIVKQRVIFS